MNGVSNPTCDRYGHILQRVGASPQAMVLSAFPKAGDIVLFSVVPQKGSTKIPHQQRTGSGSRKAKSPAMRSPERPCIDENGHRKNC
jgi:hypothetical protein